MDALQPGDPQLVGQYRLLNRLGTGGMGRVYLGESPSGQMVAVKLIRSELADNLDFRQRFAQEVAAAKRVSGTFTARVVDADPDGPQPWLVTAYVSGPSLADAVAAFGPLPPDSVRMLAAGLAEGLGAVHAAGIVHRDLKPSNVLLSADGPRIIDFGISRAADATWLTQAGRVMGSPGFMSPEQAEGREVGTAADIFSLGSVLAFAASGKSPFGSGPASALLYRVVYSSAALGHVPAELRPLIERCLAKDPAARPTTDQLLAELGAAEPAADWLSRHLPMLRAPVLQHAAGNGRKALRSDHAVHDTVADKTRPARAARPGQWPSRLPGNWRFRTGFVGWAAAVLVAGGAVSAGALVAAHQDTGNQALNTHSLSRPDQRKHGVAVRQRAPRSVVMDYFAAINAHDWRMVWRLGGDRLSPSYRSMVAGYAETIRDDIRSIRVTGDQVLVWIRAYESGGVTQVYKIEYTVKDATIASGQVLTE